VSPADTAALRNRATLINLDCGGKAVNLRSLASVVVVPLILAFAVPAHAQSSVVDSVLNELAARINNLETACGDDIKRYCSTVTPGEGRVFYCMQAHEDKIDAKCAYSVDQLSIDFQEIMNGLTKAIQACQPDIEKLCSKIQPGQGRIAACLAAGKASMTTDCAQAIEKIQAR
jgi:hypothetical protein